MSATRDELTEIYTVGHSNRSAATLISLLRAQRIRLLIDIRAFPRSRRHPHFNRTMLEEALPSRNIAYYWAGDTLGGFRKPRRDSVHRALVDATFRGFADYMETDAFTMAIESLLRRAEGRRAAIMCAEADYHHCHRQFIADHLALRGLQVNHILSASTLVPHKLHPCLDGAAHGAVYNKHEQPDLFADQ